MLRRSYGYRKAGTFAGVSLSYCRYNFKQEGGGCSDVLALVAQDQASANREVDICARACGLMKQASLLSMGPQSSFSQFKTRPLKSVRWIRNNENL
jgi:hypothetical protein